MKLIATKPVSIFWQTVFVFVMDVIAVYRIQKLRRYVKIVVIPSLILSNIPSFLNIHSYLNCDPDWWLTWIQYNTCIPYELNIFVGIVYGGFLVYSIYLVRKWSVQWNNKIEKT